MWDVAVCIYCISHAACLWSDIVFCTRNIVFKQKTAYELRMSDWSSDVCSSDLLFGVDRDVAADMAVIFEFLGQHGGAIYVNAFGDQYRDQMADLVARWRPE